MRPRVPGLRLAFACSLALAAALSGTPRAADTAPDASAPPVAASAASSLSRGPAKLSEVVAELGRSEAMRHEMASTLRLTAGWKAIAARLESSDLAADLRALEETGHSLPRARYMELVDTDTRIREQVRTVNQATAALGALSRTVEGALERLDGEIAQWPQRIALARQRAAPAELLLRMEAAGPELVALRDRLRERRDELLVAYGRGIELQGRLDALRAVIVERRERIGAELRTAESEPIWRRNAVAFPADELAADVRVARLDLLDFLSDHGIAIGTTLAALFALLLVALQRQAASAWDQVKPPRTGVAIAGALLGAGILVAVLAPRAPFIFYRIMAFASPLLGGFVATRTFAAPIPATAWALVFAVLVNEFRVVAETSPGLSQLLFSVQAVPFMMALVYDWRRGALAAFLDGWRALLVRRLVQVVVVLGTVTVVASVVGRTGLARTLTAVVVTAPGFALFFAALAWVLDQACAGLLGTPLAQVLRSVRERKQSILRALHVVVVLFCWATGIVAFAVAHSAFDDLLRVGDILVNARVTAGDVTITSSAVLSALLVIAITWIATKVVRFLLQYEILPRFDLRTGVPIAISTIVGYVLVVTGFVLALAALGIDLTKVTLLAGALGVGVGLGLQGVVSNFVSGLILMVERPINVGDQIDVGGVLGEVKRIGVRSSTIRTLQGAEVVVPNSDLASKQVVNWTLSDRARRYEIDVGVAYGSDPAQVLALLEGAVANLPDVLNDPPPRALFVGFGESSLDFRLFAWVASVDVGLRAQNEMRVAILQALDAAGIGIPFPQRDLNIRHGPIAGMPQAREETRDAAPSPGKRPATDPGVAAASAGAK